MSGHLTLDDIVTAIENKRGTQVPDKSLNPTRQAPRIEFCLVAK